MPLTAKEIGLMLRSGYSSETILNDLATRHFSGTLDANSESELIKANASPILIQALKTGKLAASTDELVNAQQRTQANQVAAQRFAQQQRAVAAEEARAAEQIARQQRIGLQNGNAGNSTPRWPQERPQAAMKVIDLQIGQTLDLRDFGANRQVIVNGVDIDGVLITLLDFDRMQVVGGGYIDGEYGGSVSYHSEPTLSRKKVPKGDRSVIYEWGRTKLVYLDVMDVSQNHIKLGIVSE